MRSRPSLGDLCGRSAEGAVFGVLGAVLPTLGAPLVMAPLALVSGASGRQRGWLARIVEASTGLASCLLVMVAAAALPLKPLDRRLEVEGVVTAGVVLLALERARIPSHVGADFDESVEVLLPPRPRARQAFDAVAEATGTTWRARGCASGANLLTGLDTVRVFLLEAPEPRPPGARDVR